MFSDFRWKSEMIIFGVHDGKAVSAHHKHFKNNKDIEKVRKSFSEKWIRSQVVVYCVISVYVLAWSE